LVHSPPYCFCVAADAATRHAGPEPLPGDPVSLEPAAR
jgi:hypothetical protein